MAFCLGNGYDGVTDIGKLDYDGYGSCYRSVDGVLEKREFVQVDGKLFWVRDDIERVLT